MKRELFIGLMILLLTISFYGLSNALPIENTLDSANFEDVWVDDGGTGYWETFAYYQNSGTLLFVAAGENDNNDADVLAALVAFDSSYQGLSLTSTTQVEIQNYDENGDPVGNWITAGDDVSDADSEDSGQWRVTSPANGTINFYSVKANNGYALYLVDPAEGTGSWSTFDLWSQVGRGDGLEISHFTAFNPGSTPVPEPATMLLFGAGLAGLAGFSRRRKSRK